MSKTARQDSVWNYTVEPIKLLTPEGDDSGFIGNRRIDTKEVLGVVSEKYNILQNNSLFSRADEVFNEMGLSTKKVQYIVTKGGAQARAIYTFENIGVKIAEKDDLILRLSVANSFDGSIGAMFEVGFLRLVCTNGLLAPAGRGTTINKKHTITAEASFTENKVRSAIDAFRNGADLFRPFISNHISTRQGANILGNLAQRKVISSKMAEGINQIWGSPTYSTDSGRNYWSLYNAATEFITHQVAPYRYELAQRATQGVVNALNKAARGQDIEIVQSVPDEEYALN